MEFVFEEVAEVVSLGGGGSGFELVDIFVEPLLGISCVGSIHPTPDTGAAAPDPTGHRHLRGVADDPADNASHLAPGHSAWNAPNHAAAGHRRRSVGLF